MGWDFEWFGGCGCVCGVSGLVLWDWVSALEFDVLVAFC